VTLNALRKSVLNKTAEYELGTHVCSIVGKYFLCSENAIVEDWRQAIERFRTSCANPLAGLTVHRVDRPSNNPLFLIIDAQVEPRSCSLFKTLSAREKEIAELAAQGYSPLNIGALLSISTGTVRVHLKNIYRKLRVTSRVELALKMYL
jgi:DNA-binding CsgD family transcriptional regulator